VAGRLLKPSPSLQRKLDLVLRRTFLLRRNIYLIIIGKVAFQVWDQCGVLALASDGRWDGNRCAMRRKRRWKRRARAPAVCARHKAGTTPPNLDRHNARRFP
jgi:hypothetical protein